MKQGLGSFSALAGPFGTSCWLAWIMVVYSGDAFLAPAEEAYASSSYAFLLSTFSLSACLIVAALFPTRASSLVKSGKTLVGLSIVGAVASLGLSFSSDSLPLLAACSLLTGVATSAIVLRCGSWTSELDAKDMLIGMGMALSEGVLVYGMASIAGVYFGSVLVAVIMALLLPCSAIVLSFEDASEDAQAQASTQMPGAFWRLAAFMFILAFALCSIRGYYPNVMDIELFDASRTAVALLLFAVVAVMVAFATKIPRNAPMSGWFYGVLIVTTLCVVFVPILGFGSFAGGVLGSILFGVVLFVDWAWLSRVSYRSGASAARVFGFGFGFASFGTTAGYALGAGLFEIGLGDVTMVGIVLVVACLAAAVLLLRKDDIVRLVTPVDVEAEVEQGDEETLSGSGDDAAAGAALGMRALQQGADRDAQDDAQDGEQDEEQDGGPFSGMPLFRLRCHLIAERHGLSARETDVFLLLAKGKDAQSIADELFISFNTARTHIRHVYTKLDVHSRRELIELVDRERIDA